jgi:hypothetical protein
MEWSGDQYTGKMQERYIPATPASDVFYDAGAKTLSIKTTKINVAALKK